MQKEWYKRAHRWTQINLTEPDARDADIERWRSFWRLYDIQGIIVNAGGTVGYFPSSNPYQYRSKYLGDRDLLGEFVQAAREEGMAVVARMDLGTGNQKLFQDKPEWFMRDIQGKPLTIGGNYLTCVNSAYYQDHIPAVMQEVIERYQVDGLVDNSWPGVFGKICYCESCSKKFKEYSGRVLPVKDDPQDETYRLWYKWSIARRTEIWTEFNRLVRELGGEDCQWMGYVEPDFYKHDQNDRLYDYAAVQRDMKAVMLDSQSRYPYFEQNSFNGLAIREVFGESALVVESAGVFNMNSGASDRYVFRKTAGVSQEVSTWFRAGISAGIVPNLHFIGALQEDERVFEVCAEELSWQKKQEKYLFDRKNMANVAVAWNRDNLFLTDGKDPIQSVRQPFYGMVAALERGRIGYFPVNIGQIDEKSDRIKVLVLSGMTNACDADVDAVIRFIKNGGSILMSGKPCRFNEYGDKRESSPILDFFGIRITENEELNNIRREERRTPLHNYMRLTEKTHPIFNGFEKTDMLGLHGELLVTESEKLAPIAHFIPEFTVYPPEFAYMEDDQKTSDVPVIYAGETGFGGRVIYLASDIDRCYGESRHPDFGRILVNAFEWLLDGDKPFSVVGPGVLDCILYEQPSRLILSVVNYSGLNVWPAPVEEYYTVGPEVIRVNTFGCKIQKVWLCDAEEEINFTEQDGYITFTVPRITKQELIIME